MKCVNKKYEYVILNETQTAFEWYNDYLLKICKKNNWRLWKVEYNLTQALSKIINNRRASDVDSGIEWINNKIDGIRRSEEILRNLFENVHETQWPHLLSRWGWYDNDVMDTWLYNENIGWMLMFDINIEFEIWKEGVKYANDPKQFNLAWLLPMPKSAVDPIYIQTVRTWLNYLDCEYEPSGFFSPTHLSWILHSYWNYWDHRHYVTVDECISNGEPVCVLDRNKKRVFERFEKQTRYERIVWLWNNQIYSHRTSTGTLCNEFIHGWINYHYIQKSKRSVLLAEVQHAVLMLTFNQQHSSYMFNNNDFDWPDAIIRQMKEIYSELTLMKKYLSNSNQPQKILNKVHQKLKHSGKEWEAKYIASHEFVPISLVYGKNREFNNAKILKYLLNITTPSQSKTLKESIFENGFDDEFDETNFSNPVSKKTLINIAEYIKKLNKEIDDYQRQQDALRNPPTNQILNVNDHEGIC